jgi:hypothetical protein
MKISYQKTPLSKSERNSLLVALLGCGGCLLPLPLLFLNLWPLRFSVPALLVPSLVLLAALGIYASRVNIPAFWTFYSWGFIGGLVGTVAYDVTRVSGLLVKFTGFEVIHKFGLLITGSLELTWTAWIIGWAYHFLNGGVFGITFALMLGRRATVLTGIAWGILLEIAMVITYPPTFGIDMGWGSVGLTVSFLGHAAYGATLGYTLKRVALKLA